jgi:hypothetical protein
MSIYNHLEFKHFKYIVAIAEEVLLRLPPLACLLLSRP